VYLTGIQQQQKNYQLIEQVSVAAEWRVSDGMTSNSSRLTLANMTLL